MLLAEFLGARSDAKHGISSTISLAWQLCEVGPVNGESLPRSELISAGAGTLILTPT